METTYKVHSVNSDDYKMWHLEWGSLSRPIPIHPSARSLIAQMFVACLLCAGHWSSRVQQWTRQSPAVRNHMFHVPREQWTNHYLIKCQVVRSVWVRLALRAITGRVANRKISYFSVTSLSSSGPTLFCSKDSNKEVKHIERKSYCSRFPVFKTP